MVEENRNWFQRISDLDPAVLRAFLVALAAVLVQVFNETVISDDDVNSVIDFFTAAMAIIAGFIIRPAVTPNAKVISYLPDPDQPAIVAPGDALPAEGVQQELLTASYNKAA